MNLKLHEIITLHHELNGDTKTAGLLKQRMSQKLKIFLHRLSKMTAEEFKQFEEVRMELYKKYGEEKDNQIVVAPDNIKDLNKELHELLDADKEVDTKPFWGEANIVELIETVESEEYYPTLYKLIGI